MIAAVDGQCFVWGSHAFVALDTMPPDSNFYSPTRVPIPYETPAVKVAAGFGFNVVMISNGEGIYGWGRNDRGQLGIGYSRKSVRDEPVFIPLPKTMKLPLTVRHVATGTDYVVLCVSPAKGCIYTWGAHRITDPPPEKSDGTGDKGKDPSGGGGNVNPFMRFKQPDKKAAAKGGAGGAAKPPFKAWTEVRAVCEPVLVTHPLWKGRPIIDAVCTPPRQIAVLTDLGAVYGLQSFTVKWIEKEKSDEDLKKTDGDSARPAAYSLFFQAKKPKTSNTNTGAKGENGLSSQKKPPPPSAQVSPVKGKFSLEPGLYSFRFCRPARVVVKRLRSSYSNVSCSTIWTHSVRRTRRVTEDEAETAEPEVLKEKVSCTGDPLQFPPSVLARAQQAYKDIQEQQAHASMQPLPKHKDYIPRRTDLMLENLGPDPRLLARMRSEYSKDAVRSPLLYFGAEHSHEELSDEDSS
ncbi:myosin head (motor domain) domain-containing protein [Cystoisospora suis]|uniref:Myosin head (Motor domain) domain-containing protein n=1 Tax=Cystoisospora suis TaxID=483139 RepID=A0A2C6L1V0_9APIC|nr:myosin head (motor domain) domain-containing protein [Cystoisospora suis]